MAQHDVLTTVQRVESKLELLQELSAKIARIEEALQQLQAQRNRSLSPSPAQSCSLRGPLTRGHVPSVNEEEPLPPSQAPRQLKIMPEAQSDAALRRQKSMSFSKNAYSMEHIADTVARDLMTARISRASNEADGKKAFGDVEQPALGERSDSRNTNQAVLQKTQKLSLDELRTNHDMVARASNAFTVEKSQREADGLTAFAKLWLCITGVIDLCRASFVWRGVLVLLSLAATVFMFRSNDDPQLTWITTFYLFCVVLSIWILRHGAIQEFVGESECNLEVYARRLGFIREWRRASTRRLLEMIGFFLLMCGTRCLAWPTAVPFAWLHFAVFAAASWCFTAIAYAQLHLMAGLALAVDSFTLNFLRVMSFEEALAEWNVLQATLRHVSSRLSRSLLVLALSCFALLVYLIELAFLTSLPATALSFILQHVWCLPPVFAFLYTLMRAATVTEKITKVSPLVNSWSFEGDHECEHGLDHRRQYVVQYIIQSEAGFYMLGLRIRLFQVSKLCYYFCAVMFAIGSRLTNSSL